VEKYFTSFPDNIVQPPLPEADAQFTLFVCRQYYSYKESPDKDKCITLVAIHYLLAVTTTISLIITTFVLLIVCGVSVNDNDIKRQGTAIWWGQSVWMVLAAAVVTCE
jgi:hypothetical protein